MAWVTFGGFSILDDANVSNINTTFIVYERLEQARRRIEPGQDSRQSPPEVASIRRLWFLWWCRRPSGAWASQAASR